MVSLGQVQEYGDDRNQAYGSNAADFQVSSPKRKKAAPTKRSQSLEVPQMPLLKVWKQEVGDDTTIQDKKPPLNKHHNILASDRRAELVHSYRKT